VEDCKEALTGKEETVEILAILIEQKIAKSVEKIENLKEEEIYNNVTIRRNIG